MPFLSLKKKLISDVQTEMNENRGSLILALLSFHCCLVKLQLPQPKRKERQLIRKYRYWQL